MLNELYQETILDHGRKPRNFGLLPMVTHCAEGHNPLCGDQIRVHLLIEDDTIQDISFEGCGCAISLASASLMSSAIKGKKVGEALGLFERFHATVTNASDEELGIGDLDCLIGVRDHANRIKCATLAWHALKVAVQSPVTQSQELP
ncbi:MAG: SUF system NifU family Fe-S cluster assembly protein [Fimbriimonadaceae bacterium]|jgi:nitrogen fixation NifU-like protein|nr:SUF system NifU family Fe-S cluster assembly protein [Fimbriimonadaceae bacterium]